MEMYFQGQAFLNRGWLPEHLAQALALFERALTLDSQNVEAMLGIPQVDMICGAAFNADNQAAFLADAETMVSKALGLAPNNALAHLYRGNVLINTNRMPQGIAECERALVLDRNLADAHAQIGTAKYFLGRGAETEAHIEEALRFSPRDTRVYRWLARVGFAKLQLAADGEAVDWFSRSIEANGNYSLGQFGLAAALALVGSLNQARASVQVGLAVNPNFTLRRRSPRGEEPEVPWLSGRADVARWKDVALLRPDRCRHRDCVLPDARLRSLRDRRRPCPWAAPGRDTHSGRP
jgi:tetratricopeptide (TPR) repeat protein